MKYFGPDSGFYKFMQTLLNLMKINFLWMICSLPIVTLGGATIAAFDISMKMLDDEEGHVGREFLYSFKRNFINGIPYGLLLLFACYAVWLNFSLFNQIQGNPIILLIMGVVGVFVTFLCFVFAFALQAKYENSLINTLKNSADIAMKYFVRTITLIIVLVLEIFVIFWDTTTLFIGVLLGPACIIYTISGYARYYFRLIEQEPGSVIYPDEES